VFTDVKNPLIGDNGASNVYGPQKGASIEAVHLLDRGLANLNQQFIKIFN
jgi:glycerate kinase